METIAFSRDTPAPELLPLEELADCASTVLARDGKSILSYGPGGGWAPLRELIGDWFKVHPARVVLTNGALHGLELIARPLAANKTIMCETPIYDRGYKVFLAAHAALVFADVDEHGIDPIRLEAERFPQRPPVLLYTTPTFHNPTGTTLTEERRRTIADWCRHWRIGILEDDAYGLLRFEGKALPRMFDYTQGSSIYLSSFSNTIAPGLRVGFMILEERFAEQVTAIATDVYITPVLLSQAVVHEFLTRGSFAPHLERMNDMLCQRRDAMLAALEKHFAGAKWTRPEGGYFIWLELPFGTDTRAVLAGAQGVTAVPGTEFTAPANFLRLSYSYAAVDEIDEGVARLAAAVG